MVSWLKNIYLQINLPKSFADFMRPASGQTTAHRYKCGQLEVCVVVLVSMRLCLCFYFTFFKFVFAFVALLNFHLTPARGFCDFQLPNAK